MFAKRFGSLGILILALSSCGGTASPQSSAASPPPSTQSTQASVAGSARPSPAASAESGSKSLDALVADARKEGSLHAQIIDQARPDADKVGKAFLKRFGLNIDINVGGENETTTFQKAQAAIRAGGAPDFDVMVGEDGNNFSFIKQGLIAKIDNWQELLTAVNPSVSGHKVTAEQVSPGPFAGYSFLTATRDESIIFNTKLIQENELPQVHPDLANPKYKGKFNLPPWSTTFTLGSLIYPKDNWVQTVDAVGKNAGAVLFPQEGVNRIERGDFAFAPMNYLYYSTNRAKDPNTPLGVTFFKDAAFSYKVFQAVPQRSKHPAAATLFALWMTTDEARAQLRPSLVQENIDTGQTELDNTVRQAIKTSNAKLLTWFSDAKSQSEFEWLTTTDDGRKYDQAIGQGLTQRK